MSIARLTYRCPHCESALELEPQATDQLLSCPSPLCGKPFRAEVPTAAPVNRIIVPSGNGIEAEEDAVPTEAPPSVPLAQPAAEREDPVEVVHLDMLRRYPFRCLGYGLLGLIGLVGVVWFGVAGRTFWTLLFAVSLGYALYRLIPWWLRMRHTTVTITTKRCMVEAGVFSKESEVYPLEHVTDVQVSQGLLSRFLNVGDIVLLSNDGERKQVMLMAVPDPKRVAEHIRTRH
ncbi:MAG: PH domain-containing protein [Planctomycetes bacterium]|nr:PH domain-containing protein [Planctomycetota bacterium]